MKQTKLLLVLLLVVFSAFTVQAQKSKIGVINIGEILLLMPEYDSVQVAYQTKYESIQSDLQMMYSEFQQKQQELAQTQDQLTPIIKGMKMQELEDLQKRIETLQKGAQAELDGFEQSEIKPLLDKIRVSIKEVAKEHGFTHVINNSQEQVIYFEESFNIFPLVKKKMGLKDKVLPAAGK